jgi:hypothetical protein
VPHTPLMSRGGGWYARAQDWSERFTERATGWLWWVGVPIFAIAMIVAVVPQVSPAYRARFGSGTPGVFVALERTCQPHECEWHGDFHPDDGRTVETNVQMQTGAGKLYQGARVAAVDTGASGYVFPASGGWDWLWTSAFLIGSIGLFVAWLATLWRALARRRRRDP